MPDENPNAKPEPREVPRRSTEERRIIRRAPEDSPRVPAKREARDIPTKRKPTREAVVIPREEPPAPQGRGCMGTCGLFAGLSALIVTVVFAVMMFAFTQQVTGFFGDTWDGLKDLVGFQTNATPEVVDTQIIVLGIEKMAVLQTTSGDILIEKEVVQEKTSLLKDARLRIRYIGRVTAGIDLSKVTEQSITVGPGNRIQVVLPPAQITGCYLQDPTITYSTCGSNLLGLGNCSDTIETLQQLAYDRAMRDLYETSDKLELLDQANQQAEAAVSDLLSDLGYDQVSFTRSSEVLPPDKSCTGG